MRTITPIFLLVSLLPTLAAAPPTVAAKASDGAFTVSSTVFLALPASARANSATLGLLSVQVDSVNAVSIPGLDIAHTIVIDQISGPFPSTPYI